MNRPYTPSAFQTDRAEVATSNTLRHFRYLGARLPNGWWSAGFGLAMGISLLAAVTGQRLGIISFFGLICVLTLLFPHTVIRANARNAVMWLFPAWALFSAVWSVDPDRTLHMTALLLPTMVAGIALGGMPNRRAVGAGLGAAMMLYITYAVARSSVTVFSDTGSGGEAMTGLFSGKNFFGHLAAMTFLTAPMFLAFARGRWVSVMRGFAIYTAVVGGFALYQSHATGSILAAGIGTMVILTVLLVRHIPWQFRVVVIAAVLAVMILYVIFGQQLQDEVFKAVLSTFRKDTTLTGRTVLWEHADRLIEQHRMLGYGYGAFWYVTNPDAWMLWRMMGVAPMSGFTFHNTMRDTLVDVGWVGLGAYVVGFGYPLLRTVIYGLARGDLASAVGLGFLAYIVVRMPVETTGVSGTNIDTLLILTFLCRKVIDEAKPAPAIEPQFRSAAHESVGLIRGAPKPVRKPVRTGFVPARRG